jgi:hypothetical protein
VIYFEIFKFFVNVTTVHPGDQMMSTCALRLISGIGQIGLFVVAEQYNI